MIPLPFFLLFDLSSCEFVMGISGREEVNLRPSLTHSLFSGICGSLCLSLSFLLCSAPCLSETEIGMRKKEINSGSGEGDDLGRSFTSS